MFQPLYLWRKSLQYPSYRRMGGSQSWSGHTGEEKKSLPLPGIKSMSEDCTWILS